MTVFNGIDPAIPDEDMVCISPRQRELYGKHGTPTQFAIATRRAASDLLCTDGEAEVAILEYNAEWANAALASDAMQESKQ